MASDILKAVYRDSLCGYLAKDFCANSGLYLFYRNFLHTVEVLTLLFYTSVARLNVWPYGCVIFANRPPSLWQANKYRAV